MTALLWFVAAQGILGAFDMFYHHELKEKLPWRQSAAKEMLLHGVRNMFYAVVFLTFGWVAWEGALAWVFAFILLTEVLITLWDFVEEDRTRKLPETERVTHAILTLNYGAILALFTPILFSWSAAPTGFSHVDYGWLSWLMSLYAAGVFIWGVRDLARGLKLRRPSFAKPLTFKALKEPNQTILVTGGTGFIGARLCQHLIDDGHHVIVLTRNIAKAAEHFEGRVTLIDTLDKLHDDETVHVIINLAGEAVAQRWTPSSMKRMVDSRVDLIHELDALTKRLRHTPQLVIQASAIGVYGLHDETVFDEDAALHKDESFAQTVCTKLEDAANGFADAGIRLCMLRIGLVLEKDGGALRELLIPFDCGAGGPIGRGTQWWSWIHRDDVVGMILHCINTPTAHGIFNATAPHPVRHKTFAKALGRAMRRPAIAPMPAFVVCLLFGQMGNDIMLHGQHVVPKRAQASGYHFYYDTIESAFAAIFKR